MSQILLETILRLAAEKSIDEIRVETGKKIAFKAAGENDYRLSNNALNYPQAAGIIDFLAKNSGDMEPPKIGAATYAHTYDKTPFSISVTRSHSDIEMIIRRMEADETIEEKAKKAQEKALVFAPESKPDDAAKPASEEVSDSFKWLETLLTVMVGNRASDLHLYSGSQPIIRVDGDMTAMENFPVLTRSELEKRLFEIIPEHRKEDYSVDREIDFSLSFKGLGRFRVNVFNDMMGIGAVMRCIPEKIMSIEQLGLPQIVHEFCRIREGLILVTGATGSGKSTTLAAMIDYINGSRKKHIITIEDPIEFVYQPKSCRINQREVGVHTRSFSQALRAALREDPDIVLVGELRDLETVAMALETAETGHLVFGTLHTNTAAGTIDRIIDQFPSNQQDQIRVMLSTSLKGIIAQVLCRRKEKGRVGAYEVLNVTSAIANLIREKKTYQITSLIQTGRNYGMVSMNDSLGSLVAEGIIHPEEALANASDREGMKKILTSLGWVV